MATIKKDNKVYKKTVKDYECYRSFLRNIMVYGYRSREEYAELGISGRSYDNYKRVLLDCIDNGFISERYEGKEKILGFNSDLYNSSSNFLIDTYFNKGLKKSTAGCMLILLILKNAKEHISANDISNALHDLPNLDLDDFLSEPSIRRCLDQLEMYGYVKSKAKGNKKLYGLSVNFLDELTFEELEKLYSAISFYSNTSLLSVPGYYLAKTIEDYVHAAHNRAIAKRDIWQYRSQNYSRIVDDEIIFTILKAIQNDSSITFEYGDSKKLVSMLPKKIITDYPYGRAYLYGTDKIVYRIDKISKVKVSKSLESSSYLPKDKPAQKLALLITFNDTDDKKLVTDIKLRLKNEAGWMNKVEVSKNRYRYTASVSDALSFAPWIRTFGRFITPADECHKSLRERLYNDKKEALKGYGII